MTDEVRGAKASTCRPGRDIIAQTVEVVRSDLRVLLEQGAMELTLDLSGVAMVDSVGLGLIIATHNSLKKRGGALRVTGLSRDLLGLFRSMRLDKHFPVVGAE